MDEPFEDVILVQYLLDMTEHQLVNAEIERRFEAGEMNADGRVNFHEVVRETLPNAKFRYVRKVEGMDPRRYPEVASGEIPFDVNSFQDFLDSRRPQQQDETDD